MLASAKENNNVENAFSLLVHQLVTVHDQMAARPPPPQQEEHNNGLTVGEFVALKQRGYVPEREAQQCGC